MYLRGMLSSRLCLLLFSLATIALPAAACETEPDLVRMRGESHKEFEARLDKTHDDQWVIRRYQRETSDIAKSSAIYVARIIERDVAKAAPNTVNMPWAVVQPLHAIRGKLPKGTRKLVTTARSSCDSFGDGDASETPVGTLVFVFEGLPKNEVSPNGFDSIRTIDARTFDLLDPFYQQFGKEGAPGF